MPSELPPGRYFISHSYKDVEAREQLLASLPSHVEPVVFPPITVEPHEFVSAHLGNAIGACDGMISILSRYSQESFWVAFERQSGLRLKLGLCTWDAASDTMAHDRSIPVELAVFMDSARDDEQVAKHIVQLMLARGINPYFSYPIDTLPGESVAEAAKHGIATMIDHGGYMVAVHSERSASNESVRARIEFALARGRDRVLVAAVDGAPPPAALQGIDRATHYLDLSDGVGGISNNRIDDLWVRLYWLMFRNREL